MSAILVSLFSGKSVKVIWKGDSGSSSDMVELFGDELEAPVCDPTGLQLVWPLSQSKIPCGLEHKYKSFQHINVTLSDNNSICRSWLRKTTKS